MKFWAQGLAPSERSVSPVGQAQLPGVRGLDRAIPWGQATQLMISEADRKSCRGLWSLYCVPGTCRGLSEHLGITGLHFSHWAEKRSRRVFPLACALQDP